MLFYKRLFRLAAAIVAAAFAVGGCQSSEPAPVTPESGGDARGVRFFLDATTDTAARTSLDEGAETAAVLWEEGDAIGLFTMSDKTNGSLSRMEITSGAGSNSARFGGWLRQNEVLTNDIYFACYPCDGRTEFYYDDDQTMILNAPAVQQHREGRCAGPMAAKCRTGAESAGHVELAFRNLFAILKFTLTGGGETLYRINVFGNDGEPMAGQFYVSLTDAAMTDPAVRFNTDAFHRAPFDSAGVTLECNTVLTEQPQDFYVAVPPQYYRYGYSAEFETSAGAMIRSNGITTGKSLRRNTIYRHPAERFAADYDIALRACAHWLWQSGPQTVEEVAACRGAQGQDLSAGGNANCFIVTKAGRYCFRAVRPDGEALWGAPADTYIAFSVSEAAAARGGNAVVALLDDEEQVLWSWHIWIPCEEPRTLHTAGGTAGLMSLNLGALTSAADDVRSYGLYYQWGRKDPFPGNGEAGVNSSAGYREEEAFSTVAAEVNPGLRGARFGIVPNDSVSIATGGSVDWAAAHPMTFIYYNANIYAGNPSGEDTAHLQSGAGTWFNSYFVKFGSLWGYEHTTDTNTKTVYDPCPAGYKVPASFASAWRGVAAAAADKGALGGFECGGAYYPPAGCRDGWGDYGAARLRYTGYSTYMLTAKPSMSYCEVMATSMRASWFWYPASGGVVRCVAQ